MSGFFLVRRDALAVDALSPQGFDIPLELLASHRGLATGYFTVRFGVPPAGLVDLELPPHRPPRLPRTEEGSPSRPVRRLPAGLERRPAAACPRTGRPGRRHARALPRGHPPDPRPRLRRPLPRPRAPHPAG